MYVYDAAGNSWAIREITSNRGETRVNEVTIIDSYSCLVTLATDKVSDCHGHIQSSRDGKIK